jgi:hypothetical protein
MKADWKVIDIVTACMENHIKINFQPGKRFYRIRLRNCCGIFDMRSNCFLLTSDVIFSAEFEQQYKKTENSLEVLEDLMDEFETFRLPSLNDSQWHTVAP